nr:DUF4386 domain-containing protein [uncultured Flavobacterium sp.]
MNQRKTMTHMAGICYIIIVISGIITLMYIPNELIDWKNPQLTFKNVSEDMFLFRIGVFTSIICYLAYIALPLVLYKLLSQIHKNVAIAMVVLVLVSIPITFLNLTNKLDIISLLTNPTLTNLFSEKEKINLTFSLLHEYENGITIASIFWGLWLFPFGLLVYKSGFLPKVLGILLMLGSFGYCINIFGDVLMVDYSKLGIAGFVSIPASLGEIGICLWMLIIGPKKSLKEN